MKTLVDLPLSGVNGSTSFLDAAGNVWTATGNAQIQSNALLLDGVGDWASSNVRRLVFGTSDFNIKFKMKSAQTSQRALLDAYLPGQRSWSIYFNASGKLTMWSGEISAYVLTGSISINDNVEHQIEIDRTAGVLTFKVDGVADGSVADTRIYDASPGLAIGAQVWSRNGTYNLAGTIRDVLIVVPDTASAITHGPYFIVSQIEKKALLASRIARMLFYDFDDVNVNYRRQFYVTRRLPAWWGALQPGVPETLPTYELRGRVMQRDEVTLEDYPLPNTRVALFFRRTNYVIDMQVSDEDGYVHFPNIMPGSQAYYAIAFDPEGSPMQNSILWDRLTSVPAS